MESILTSIKKLLGLTEEDTSFDQDVIMHINTVFMDLTQLKVGPSAGFMIEDKTSVWTDFVKSPNRLQAIKSYIYLRVRLLFDPPSSAAAIASMEKQVDKFEWLINVAAESGESEDTVLIRDLKERVEALTAELSNAETDKAVAINELQFCKDWFKDTYFSTQGLGTYVFQGKNMSTIPLFDFSGFTSLEDCFQSCTALEHIPAIDTSNVTNFKNMFYGCSKLKNIPFIDTANGTDFSGMFDSCESLEAIPVLNLSKATSFTRMFRNCFSITSAEIDKLINSCNSVFYNCRKLKTVSLGDTSGVTNFGHAFWNCSSLENISELNMISCTNALNMFEYCTALTEIRFVPNTITTDLTIMSPALSDDSIWSITRGLAPSEYCPYITLDSSVTNRLTDSQWVLIFEKGWNVT